MSYSSEVLADAPLAYYRLGEASGTTAVDSSGNGHDGTYRLAPTHSASLIGDPEDTAFSSDGSNMVTIPHAGWMDTGQVTMEAWARVNSAASVSMILDKDNESSSRCFQFRIYNRKAEYIFWLTSGGPYFCTGTTDLGDNTIYHVAVTYDGTSARLYVNGVQNAVTTVSGSLATSTTDMWMAGHANTPFTAGTLDEVAYYDHALSPARIAAHYATAFGVYLSTVLDDHPVVLLPLDETTPGAGARNLGSGYQFSYGPNATVGLPGVVQGTAASCGGGSGDYVASQYGSSMTTGNVSLEVWVNLPDADVQGELIKVGGLTNGWGVGIGNGANNVPGRELVLDATNVSNQPTGYLLTPGIHHVVATRSVDDVFSWYVDGSLRGTRTFHPNGANDLTVVGNVDRGFTGTAPLSPSVVVDAPAFYNTELAASRVAAHYRAAFYVPTVQVPISRVTETDTANTLTPAVQAPPTQVIALGRALETDLAELLGAPGSEAILAIGQVIETSVAFNYTLLDTTPEEPPVTPPTPSILDGVAGGHDEPFRAETYRFFVVDVLSDSLIAELPFTEVSWGRRVSQAGDFSGTLSSVDSFAGVDVYSATMPGKTALYVMREDVAVWGGIIWNRDYTLTSNTVTITAASWESYLYRRMIWHNLVYANTTDEYVVTRDMIAKLRNDFKTVVIPSDGVDPWPVAAEVSVEVEPGNAGKTQDRQEHLGYELKSFGDVLAEYANNLKGFEYNVDVLWDPGLGRFRRTLTFRDTPPAQTPADQVYNGTRPGVDTNVFEHPGNVLDIQLAESADTAATRYWVVGGAPAGIQTDYKPRGVWANSIFLNGGWPLLEFVESSKHSTASNLDTLNGYAQLYGRRAKPPVPTWNVTVNGALDPVIGSYSPGDWCRLITDDSFIRSHLLNLGLGSTGTTKRIMGYTVNVPTVPQKPETVTLELAEEWGDS